eukprot:gene9574-6729_t
MQGSCTRTPITVKPPPVGSLVLSRRGIATSALRHARRMRGGRGRARHREPSPGDWLCQCGETNYRSKRECFKCGAPAPPLPPGVRRPSLPGEDPHDWACACGQMNFRGSVVCHKCAQPKPVPPGQETQLWTCPACKGINRDHRKTCFKCGAISPNFTLAKPQVPGQSGGNDSQSQSQRQRLSEIERESEREGRITKCIFIFTER